MRSGAQPDYHDGGRECVLISSRDKRGREGEVPESEPPRRDEAGDVGIQPKLGDPVVECGWRVERHDVDEEQDEEPELLIAYRS